MNERIRELAEQCGFVYDENFGLTADVNADAAKFAELIVKECHRCVEKYIGYCGEIGSLPDRVIKGHFGVE